MSLLIDIYSMLLISTRARLSLRPQKGRVWSATSEEVLVFQLVIDYLPLQCDGDVKKSISFMANNRRRKKRDALWSRHATFSEWSRCPIYVLRMKQILLWTSLKQHVLSPNIMNIIMNHITCTTYLYHLAAIVFRDSKRKMWKSLHNRWHHRIFVTIHALHSFVGE